jgi:hypothetical protein
MASRWAYEALVVEQFKNNKYERYFFPLDQKISNLEYNVRFNNELRNILAKTLRDISTQKNQELTIQNLNILNEQIEKLKLAVPEVKYNITKKLDINSFNESIANEIRKYLGQLDSYYNQKKSDAVLERNSLLEKLTNQLGGNEAILKFKNDYNNSSLVDLATNKRDLTPVMRYNNRLIRKFEPVYMIPTSRLGRAHFYAPVKILGNRTIDTLSFNVIVLWIMSVLLYFTLYFDVIRKTFSFFETARLRKRGAE